MKAERNKTIDFLPEDAPEYLARCLRVTEDVPLDAVCGRTICGDTFQVAPHLPRGFADLLIVDPPYNLTKDFSGGGFRRTTDANYAAFTRAWIELLLPLLKPDASVYVCCDWRSSPVIGMTLKDYFRLQNRITWQREKGRGAQRNWKNGMEDIWFATRTDDYTFHVDAVKVRRRVRAPYRADGRPKDWEETPDGKFRNTCPSNFWDDISVPYWSMPENTAHPTQKPEKLLAKLILASSDRITWQREKGRGAQRNWKNGMEDIWFATRTDDYTFHVDAVKVRRRVRAPYRADGRPKDWEETPDGKFRNTCPSNFWDDISVPYWSMPENTAHPTQKPEKLLAKLILASSDPGGIVLDPFAGSGSTAVTAKKLGRRFVAIERSEQYCAWAEKRLELAETNPAIQGYADGVFWERNAGRLPR